MCPLTAPPGPARHGVGCGGGGRGPEELGTPPAQQEMGSALSAAADRTRSAARHPTPCLHSGATPPPHLEQQLDAVERRRGRACHRPRRATRKEHPASRAAAARVETGRPGEGPASSRSADSGGGPSSLRTWSCPTACLIPVIPAAAAAVAAAAAAAPADPAAWPWPPLPRPRRRLRLQRRLRRAAAARTRRWPWWAPRPLM